MSLVLLLAALLVAILAAAVVAGVFSALAWSAARRPSAPQAHPELVTRLYMVEQAVAAVPGALREDSRGLRGELQGAFAGLRTEAATGRDALEAALKRDVDGFAHSQTTRLGETNAAVGSLADRLERQQKQAREALGLSLTAAAAAQKLALDEVNQRIERLIAANDQRQGEIRDALNGQLDKLREDNAAKLEQMRATVDEKLQGTLEQRLGESFKLVSERLDTVHKGMGEMQAMAAEVGGLKRVMSNVRARGAYGEVQLGALLEDTLTADQYERQVAVQPGSAERVDYAIVLPGHEPGGRLLVPIDCKYPHEDYERLLAAHDTGDAAAADEAGRALERAIRIQARSIGEKYVHPPLTTNFALMYLPTEGLYAEVARRPGLIADLQSTHSVTIAGPTTLQAILGSFRMVFRTLVIEKRSGEVWRVLGEAKSEFQKYGQVWDKLAKQLDTAQNTVAEAGKRTRAVARRLQGVETLEAVADAAPLLALPAMDEEED